MPIKFVGISSITTKSSSGIVGCEMGRYSPLFLLDLLEEGLEGGDVVVVAVVAAVPNTVSVVGAATEPGKLVFEP